LAYPDSIAGIDRGSWSWPDAREMSVDVRRKFLWCGEE